jgi:hypothetical protein
MLNRIWKVNRIRNPVRTSQQQQLGLFIYIQLVLRTAFIKSVAGFPTRSFVLIHWPGPFGISKKDSGPKTQRIQHYWSIETYFT